VKRTCVRTVAPPADGCKGRRRGYSTSRPIARQAPFAGMASGPAAHSAGEARRTERMRQAARSYTRRSRAPVAEFGRRARLRALWRLFSVVVRVHSGALRKPWKSGLFLVKGSSVAQVRYCSV
jgi:hypothetical protein